MRGATTTSATLTRPAHPLRRDSLTDGVGGGATLERSMRDGQARPTSVSRGT